MSKKKTVNWHTTAVIGTKFNTMKCDLKENMVVIYYVGATIDDGYDY